MAKLCSECQKKQADLSVRGSCLAGTHVASTQLPKGHVPWTESPNFTLCDTCADHFQLCAWCWGPLNGSGRVTVPTNRTFCRQFDNNNGNHVEGMFVGEQILAQLTVDLFSGKSWRVRSTSPGIRLAVQRLVVDSSSGGGFGGARYGYLELYFDLTVPDAKGYIELVEDASRSWISIPNPKTWKVTVEVKH